MNATAGMLAKIRGLIAKAESTEFPEEAATYREAAEKLIRKYRVEQEQLLETGVTRLSEVPIQITISLCPASSDFVQQYYWVWIDVAGHTEVMYHQTWGADPETGVYSLLIQVVGFEMDVKYAEMLFTSAQLVFQENLEPKVRPELDDQANAYRLRKAGLPRNRVAQMMWGSAVTGPEASAPAAKVAKLYKAECEARGENAAVSGREINAGTYRQAYASGFRTTLARRLRMAQDGADRDGGALVLGNRSALVKEAFFTAFPQYRPVPKTEAPVEKKADSKPAKASKVRGWTKADQARHDRLHYSTAALAGRGAGEVAAREVDLGGTSGTKLGDGSVTGELLG